MTTIRDVAKLAGVSPASVSYYLNGKHEHVRSDTAERIRQAIADLDYTPNPMARSLSTGLMNTVAIIVCASAAHNHGGMALLGAAERFLPTEYSLVIKPLFSPQDASNFAPKHVDGMIIVGPMGTHYPNLMEYCDTDKPILVIEDVPDDWGVTRVNANNYMAGKMVTQHFLDQGYTSISVMYHREASNSMRRRLEGCKDAMRERGLKLDSSKIIEVVGNDDDDIRSAVDQTLDMSPRPQVIIPLYVAPMKILGERIRKRNLRVPNNIAVGCADYYTPYDYHVDMPVVTLDLDLYDVGHLAASTFLEMLHEKQNRLEDRFIDPTIRVLMP